MKHKVMKMKIVLLLMVIIVCTIAGCSKDKDDSIEVRGKNYYRSGVADLVEVSSGFYMIDTSNFIKYYDKESKQTIVLCNKPECKHNSSECYGYVNYLRGTLATDGKYLYFIGMERVINEKVKEMVIEYFLCRVHLDGTVIEKLSTIKTQIVKGEETVNGLWTSNLYVTENVAYYLMYSNEEREESGVKLYRINLEKEGKITELTFIPCSDEGHGTLTLYGGYNNFLWFQIQRLGEKGFVGDIYYYDLKNKVKEKVMDNIQDARASGMEPIEDGFFYTSEGQVWKYNKNTQEKNVLIQLGDESQVYHTPFIYEDKLIVNGMNAIYVYDMEGKLIKKLEMKKENRVEGSQLDINLKGIDMDGNMIIYTIGTEELLATFYQWNLNNALNGTGVEEKIF